MIKWDGIQEFIYVVDTGSFTKAAARLKTSVANVSRQVNRLEAHLEVKLLLRTTRSISLTEAGRDYYERCKPLIDSMQEAEMAIKNHQSKPTGKLRLTAPVSFGERFIAPLVKEFLLLHPGLEIELLLGNQAFDLIGQGFDMAIRLGQLSDSTLMAKKIAPRRLKVVTAPSYFDHAPKPQSLEDLAEHNCLLGTLDYWRFWHEGEARNERVAGNFRCNSGPALLNAALSGLGLVQLPDYYIQSHLKAGELVSVLDEYEHNQEGVWAVRAQSKYVPVNVRIFTEFLEQNLSID
ncbi:MAG: LysR family transcriptional regulator [Pontibacterium sp.]